jgi:hypothetical protein
MADYNTETWLVKFMFAEPQNSIIRQEEQS